MTATKSERIVEALVSAYKTELRRDFLALTLQTDIHSSYRDIDYAVFLKNINGGIYETIARINTRLEKKYGTTLDIFLYEAKGFRKSVNPWSVEIVRRNTQAIYGKNFWRSLSYKPRQIMNGAFVYLEENREKFLRYLKNISRQRGDWITVWALDHLFVTVKIYNSLFGFWSLGKERNLREFQQVNPQLARRLAAVYKLRHKAVKKGPLHYLAQCYALSERISALAQKTTLHSFLSSYKREPAVN